MNIPFTQKLTNLNIEYKENVPMSEHTSFKIGGNADIFITVKNISAQMQQEADAFDRLEKRLSALIEQMMTHAGGVVEQRIMQLEAVMKTIHSQANIGVSLLEKERAAIQHKIHNIDCTICKCIR